MGLYYDGGIDVHPPLPELPTVATPDTTLVLLAARGSSDDPPEEPRGLVGGGRGGKAAQANRQMDKRVQAKDDLKQRIPVLVRYHDTHLDKMVNIEYNRKLGSTLSELLARIYTDRAKAVEEFADAATLTEIRRTTTEHYKALFALDLPEEMKDMGFKITCFKITGSSASATPFTNPLVTLKPMDTYIKDLLDDDSPADIVNQTLHLDLVNKRLLVTRTPQHLLQPTAKERRRQQEVERRHAGDEEHCEADRQYEDGR